MSPDSDWPEVARQLTLLQSHADSAHRAALDSIGSGNADHFVKCLADLGPALSQAQVAWSQPTATQPMPAALVLQVEQLRNSLDALHALNSRLSAQAQRSLAVLFPVDPMQSYSRLGGGRGVGGAGKGYLKA